MSRPAIGVFLPTMVERAERFPDLATAARHAEDLGFESAWAVDQLVGGTGVPLVDSAVALGVAAGATSRLRLAYGVMILPLRPAVWAAKQVASLQEASHGRVLLGVGVGGDRHELSWAAAGVSRRRRGRDTDAALAVLPDLVAGKAVELDGRTVRLAPGTPVPPIIIGGMSEAAIARTAAHGDGWFTLPLPPAGLAPAIERLRELADDRGRPAPAITGSVMASIAGDPTRPDRAGLARRLTDPDGVYGMPAGAIDDMVLTGGPAAVAERIAAFADLGAERVVLSLAGGDWIRQAELAAEAAALVT